MQWRFMTLDEKQKCPYLMLLIYFNNTYLPAFKGGGWVRTCQSSTEKIAWSWTVQINRRGKHSDTEWRQEAYSLSSLQQPVAKGILLSSSLSMQLQHRGVVNTSLYLHLGVFKGFDTLQRYHVFALYHLNLSNFWWWWASCALTLHKPLLKFAKRYEITFAFFVL